LSAGSGTARTISGMGTVTNARLSISKALPTDWNAIALIARGV